MSEVTKVDRSCLLKADAAAEAMVEAKIGLLAAHLAISLDSNLLTVHLDAVLIELLRIFRVDAAELVDIRLAVTAATAPAHAGRERDRTWAGEYSHAIGSSMRLLRTMVAEVRRRSPLLATKSVPSK